MGDPEEEMIKPVPTGVMGIKKKKRELPDWMKANALSPKKSKTAVSLPSALNQKYLENVTHLSSGLALKQAVKEDEDKPKKNGVGKVQTTSQSPFVISDEDEPKQRRV